MNLTPEDLGRKIKEAQAKQGQTLDTPARKGADQSAAGRAMRAGIDLVAALVVGGFMGYWLDKWLGTKPLFMIVFFFLGFAAGFLNIYRAETGQDFKVGLGDIGKPGRHTEDKPAEDKTDGNKTDDKTIKEQKE